MLYFVFPENLFLSSVFPILAVSSEFFQFLYIYTATFCPRDLQDFISALRSRAIHAGGHLVPLPGDSPQSVSTSKRHAHLRIRLPLCVKPKEYDSCIFGWYICIPFCWRCSELLPATRILFFYALFLMLKEVLPAIAGRPVATRPTCSPHLPTEDSIDGCGFGYTRPAPF